MNVDYINARFNGADVRFHLKRERLAAFEGLTGSAFALMRRITGGTWTVEDIRTVLRFSYPNGFGQLSDNTPIGRAIKKHGAATYAPLCAMVLTAALAGLPEASANFSDEDDE